MAIAAATSALTVSLAIALPAPPVLALTRKREQSTDRPRSGSIKPHIGGAIRVHIDTEFGLENIGRPYIKHVQSKIWELRASGKDTQGRCLYVTATGKRVVILRCFIKKSQKIKQKEIRIALERAKEVHDEQKP